MSRPRRWMRRRPVRQVAAVEQTLRETEAQLLTVAARLGGIDGRILAQAAKTVRSANTHVRACRIRLNHVELTTPAGELVAILPRRRLS